MENITVYRKRSDMTQAELAAKLGVSQVAVARMEMPGCYPSAEKLPAIADALSCSIDALFGRSPPPASHFSP